MQNFASYSTKLHSCNNKIIKLIIIKHIYSNLRNYYTPMLTIKHISYISTTALYKHHITEKYLLHITDSTKIPLRWLLAISSTVCHIFN